MNNLETWDKLARPPKDALKQIAGGRLKGMTDINPQWRYKAFTELFGMVSSGWNYEIVKLWTEKGEDGQIFAFAQVAVSVGQFPPVPGVGGSMLIEKDKYGLHHNDEAYKMAITDALSVAMKMFGVGADIYMGRFDGSKYKDDPNPSSGAGTKKEAYDSLSADDKAWVDNLASEAIAIFETDGVEKTIEHIKASLGDNSALEYKLAIWWKLPSNVRTALDAIQKGLKR